MIDQLKMCRIFQMPRHVNSSRVRSEGKGIDAAAGPGTSVLAKQGTSWHYSLTAEDCRGATAEDRSPDSATGTAIWVNWGLWWNGSGLGSDGRCSFSGGLYARRGAVGARRGSLSGPAANRHL